MRNEISHKITVTDFHQNTFSFENFSKKESLASLFNEQKNKSAADDTKKLISNNQ